MMGRRKLLLTAEWKALAKLAKQLIDAIALDDWPVSTRNLPNPPLLLGTPSLPSLERYYEEPGWTVFPATIRFVTQSLGVSIGLDSSSSTPQQSSISDGEWWKVPLADQIRCAAEEATGRLGPVATQLRNLVHQTEPLSELAIALEESAGKKLETNLKESDCELLIEIRAIRVSLASLVVYQKPIFFLYREAKGGDDQAFFDLVTLDKAMAATEWAGLRIKEAALANDAEFFRHLSVALRKDPRRTKRRQMRLAAFLFVFWPLGFRELRPAERFAFLEAAGFKDDEIPREETLNKFLARCKFSQVWGGLSDELQRVVAMLAGEQALEKTNQTHVFGPFL